MPFSNSRVFHRIVGRFEKDERLPDALVRLCKSAEIRAGRIQAHGIVSKVELGQYREASSEYEQTFASDGMSELVSLNGNISMLGPTCIINAYVLVAFNSHGHNGVVGGQLRSAKVFNVEYVIDVFEDLRMERALDPVTKLPILNKIELSEPEEVAKPKSPEPVVQLKKSAPDFKRVATIESKSPRPVKAQPPKEVPEKKTKTAAPPKEKPPEKPTQPASSKADWLKAAQRAKKPPDESGFATDDYPIIDLEPGDILLHPRLGECEVVKVEDDVAAHIRLPHSRRISKLALTVVRLEPAGERNGAQVYRVRAG